MRVRTLSDKINAFWGKNREKKKVRHTHKLCTRFAAPRRDREEKASLLRGGGGGGGPEEDDVCVFSRREVLRVP